MSTLSYSPSGSLAQRQPQGPEGFSRLATLWRFLREVLAEAQEMRRDAHRRYPFIDA